MLVGMRLVVHGVHVEKIHVGNYHLHLVWSGNISAMRGPLVSMPTNSAYRRNICRWWLERQRVQHHYLEIQIMQELRRHKQHVCFQILYGIHIHVYDRIRSEQKKRSLLQMIILGL